MIKWAAWRIGKEGAAFIRINRVCLSVGYNLSYFSLELLSISYLFKTLTIRIALCWIYASFTIDPKITKHKYYI